jgi:hypothetical protein
MAASTVRTLWYVYGIVPPGMAGSGLPSGLDDAAVALERDGGVGALTSVLDASAYEASSLETNSGSVEWLSPRAIAHDRVLTWASDHGPIIPLPMFSLFSSAAAVHQMLRDRARQLVEMLEYVRRGREYALRVYRVDAELFTAVPSLSPRLAGMARAAAAAAPGQRYLLQRKLDAEQRAEMRTVSQRLVDEIVAALSLHAIEAVRSPIPRADADASGSGTMVLNGAFLVEADSLPAFQQTLTTLVTAHQAHGLRFDFTGPWPPYHFVAEHAHAG